MPIQQGINKTLAVVKQSGLGSPGSTGSQYMRRTSSVFSEAVRTFENNEIVSHQQSTGVNYAGVASNGKIDGVLSPKTYAGLFAALLRKDFVATSAITGLSLTIAVSGQNWTITRSTGDFLTGGIKLYDVIRLTAGSFNAANLNKNLLVIGVTATVLTVTPVNGVALVAEGPIASATVAVPGKKSWAPLTGHTNDYFSVEEGMNNLTRFELHTDVQVARAALNIPGSDNATVSFDMVGLNRSESASQTLTSPTAETTTPVLGTTSGVVAFAGGKVTNILSMSLNIDGATSQLDPTVGSTVSPDNQRGRVSVSGSFQAYYDGIGFQTPFVNRTVTSLAVVLADSLLASADFVSFAMSRVKITSDAPDDGEKAIVRTYNFTAEIDIAGGANLASLQTILSTQDSQA